MSSTTNSTSPTNPTTTTTSTTTSHSITDGVKDFLKGAHKADSTEVRTEIAPEVVQEVRHNKEHVETAEAIDRERHIIHHQHRIQPIAHQNVLPTQHVQSVGAASVREHKEDMLPEHQAKLTEQRNLYKDTTQTLDTERSAAHVGTHVNTHEHHHIHETIQPVIQRETIQPTVVHHTTAIHEKIHEAPIVHEATTLPTLTHEEFLKQKASGGELASERASTHQYYEGAPRVGGQSATESTTTKSTTA